MNKITMKNSLLAFCLVMPGLVSGFYSMDVEALSVEEAYKAIPHRRTVFDAQDAGITQAQSAALQNLFSFSDDATVLRVEGLQAMHNNDADSLTKIIDSYRSLLSNYASESTNADVRTISELFIQAVQLHQKYFELKLQEQKKTGKFTMNFTADVNSSSQKLIQAYGLLIKKFPNTSAINKTAYYDYPCALDFQ